MGASTGCCASCNTTGNKETLSTTLVQPSSPSREKKSNKDGKKSSPLSSGSPRATQKGNSSRAGSKNGSGSSSPRGIVNGNSGGTGETPDTQDDSLGRSAGGTGASGVGLGRKTKLDKERRKTRVSQFQQPTAAIKEEAEEEMSALDQPAVQVSLKERVGRKSFLDFSTPQQTIVIFDWDDTLFPTTWIQEDMEVNIGQPCPKNKEVLGPLKQCASRAADVLRLTATLAQQVSIVTLAESPWVDYTIRNFYGSMEKLLANLGVRIIYARDAAAQAEGGKKEEGVYDKQSFQSDQERAAYWTGVKGTAIRLECERFYSQYAQQTWKNVISIGDSDFEKEGTIEVTRQYVLSKKQTGAYQLPRTKTVKFLDSPTAEELCNELRLIKHWMPTLIRKDSGFNLDFEEIGERTVEDISVLLNDASAFDAEPRCEALFDNLFWKKDKNGDPFKEACWRPRRIWLSKTGHMWYESLKDVKAMELFDGASVGDLEVAKLTPGLDILPNIEGMPVFGISFKAKDSDGNADFLVLAQSEDREELLKQIESFQKKPKMKKGATGAVKS